jgi:hypothetical protein
MLGAEYMMLQRELVTMVKMVTTSISLERMHLVRTSLVVSKLI